MLVPERVIRFLAPFVHLLLSHLLFTHLFLHRLMVLHLVAAHVQLIHHLVILVVVLNLVAETLLVLKLLLRHLSRNHIIMRFLMPLFILPCLLFLYRLQAHPVFVAVGLALFAHLLLDLFTAVKLAHMRDLLGLFDLFLHEPLVHGLASPLVLIALIFRYVKKLLFDFGLCLTN